jgi:hypothetical protein
MANTIKDGTGTGSQAKVNENNRLYVNGVVIDEDLQATKIGNSYNINTGELSLTNDSKTPVLYLKNNEDQPLNITAIIVGLGTSTNGTTTDIARITVERNPNGGDIISTASAVDINSNRNFGDSKNLDVDAYKGGTGVTMTGGTDHLFIFQDDFGRLSASIDGILPKGSTIGIAIEPPENNTALPCYIALICHLEDAKE